MGRRGMAARLRDGDTYGLVLALIAITYVLLAVLEDTAWNRVVISAALGGILLLSLWASHTRGRLMRVAVLVTVVAFVVAISQGPTGGDSTFSTIAGSLIFPLIVMAPIAITARIVRHPRVSLETILGAICAYLLIGMLFAGLYRAADAMSEASFFAQTATPTPVQYVYFSFITLTTVGFGDLTAATDSGRVMVSFEAVLGQVFLVTIVAGLISSYGQARHSGRRLHEGADGEEDAAGP